MKIKDMPSGIIGFTKCAMKKMLAGEFDSAGTLEFGFEVLEIYEYGVRVRLIASDDSGDRILRSRDEMVLSAGETLTCQIQVPYEIVLTG